MDPGVQRLPTAQGCDGRKGSSEFRRKETYACRSSGLGKLSGHPFGLFAGSGKFQGGRSRVLGRASRAGFRLLDHGFGLLWLRQETQCAMRNGPEEQAAFTEQDRQRVFKALPGQGHFGSGQSPIVHRNQTEEQGSQSSVEDPKANHVPADPLVRFAPCNGLLNMFWLFGDSVRGIDKPAGEVD